jgi:cbb3-type cytochrome oxidase maturation protein
MDILYLLVPLSVVLAVCIGAAFWRAVDTGQFDDLDTPGVRVLADDDGIPAPRNAQHSDPRDA